ncbi:MAG: transcription antitermination factor NusB [Actinobacteria bacterium]|nr:transcription antitermination factor NusB [Actinomycetota bacterium]MDA2981688.1 transcription antitermination factor NusB [Actinomycetota bacterium]MDA2996586.1 transcription antitermination factor NusB [Actinomycetota bacterium]
MSARRKARKRALDFLYEADIRSARAIDLLESRGEIELSERDYVLELLLGVETNALKIDELITTYAQGWDMDRMPAIDRNILRISLFEILFKNDLDDQVAASEAVEIATELSTEDSAKYINGVLGRIIILKPSFAL